MLDVTQARISIFLVDNVALLGITYKGTPKLFNNGLINNEHSAKTVSIWEVQNHCLLLHKPPCPQAKGLKNNATCAICSPLSKSIYNYLIHCLTP